MPVLTLKFKDRKIQDYPIAVGQTCTIGRKQTNDIVIDNLAVSGSHATVESVATTFVLRDLDSTNGTFVNQKKVSQHNLHHKDVILIGKHEIIFDRSDLIKKGKTVADPYLDEKTRVLETDDFKNILDKNSATPENESVVYQQDPAPRSFFGRLLQKIFG